MSFPNGPNFANLEDGNAKVTIETRDKPHHRKYIPVTTVDSDDDDERLSENEINWAELPSLAVENIYSFLSRTDQSRMSQVCSRWSNDFNSPCVWKTMKFYLPEQDYSSDIYPEVRFALKYAQMFRHVEIICKTVRYHLIHVIFKQLINFLKAIASSSQLISIKFINLGKYFRQVDDIDYIIILKSIIRFFHSQKNLTTVVFENSYLSKEEGMELLKAIFHSDINTISNLSILGFVDETATTVLNSQYSSDLRKVSCRIANIQSLEVNYTQIFEDVINEMYEMLSSGSYQLYKKNTSKTTLVIYSEDKEHAAFRGILPGTWKYLTKVFPNLKVKMDVTIHRNLTNEMEKFLMREIPLEALDLRFRSISSSTDISDLLTYLQICKYQNHLEVLNIIWLPPIAAFSESIIPFVESCKKLKTFHLHVECTPTEIEDVFIAFLENHPKSLKSITLWFNSLQVGEDINNLKALSEKYYALFKAQGMDWFLIVDGHSNRLPIQGHQ